MYESDDPRSRLSTAAGGGSTAPSAFGASTYARWHDGDPQETGQGHKSWYTRGQNFVVCYSEVEDGTSFERAGQVDEYVLLLPDLDVTARIEANGQTQDVGGFSVTMIPPGDSKITFAGAGRIVRLISTRSADVCAKASNGEKYAGTHPQIPPFQAWPEPAGGFKIRNYSLDVPDEEGRFGKIFRCTTFMVNVFPPAGPRDPAKLSPHHHDDFEQCSLAIGGTYEHHLRWPWTANKADWQADEHEVCGTPSVCIIPPRVIHTSASLDEGQGNLLIDIFSPPREDFSDVAGWVLNAEDYPRI